MRYKKKSHGPSVYRDRTHVTDKNPVYRADVTVYGKRVRARFHNVDDAWLWVERQMASSRRYGREYHAYAVSA